MSTKSTSFGEVKGKRSNLFLSFIRDGDRRSSAASRKQIVSFGHNELFSLDAQVEIVCEIMPSLVSPNI